MQKDPGSNYQEYKERLTNFSNEFDLGLFLYILRRSGFWILLLFMISVGGAFLFLKYTAPVFKAKVIIQLGQSDNANKILNVGAGSEENDVQAKLELLRSKLLVQRTVEKIPIGISYYAKGELLTNEHYILSPYELENMVLLDESLRDIPIFLFFRDQNTVDLKIRDEDFSGLDIRERIELPGLSFNLRIKDWERVVDNQDESKLYFVANSKRTLTQRFYEGLSVRILNNVAKTLEISYEDNNPFIARDFAMALSNEFINFDLESKSLSDENILAFVDSQIDTVFERLRNSELLLNEYKQENKISDPKELADVYFSRINQFEDEIIQLELEERVLTEIEGLTTRESGDIAVYNLVPLVAGSKYEGALAGMLQNLYDLLIKKEEALYSVTIDNNRIRSIEYQIGIQRNMIIETIKALKENIKERRMGLEGKAGEVEGQFYNLPSKELEVARLERLFNINEKYYTLLLEKRIEYRISKEGFVSNNQILEDAKVPRIPVSPRRNVVFLSFLVGGFLLSIALISLRYLLHNDITSLNEIVRLSNGSIPTLGILPRYTEEIPVSMLLIDRDPKSIISESFRNLRTNLQFVDNCPGSKIVAVTSTISGEGKTFVSLNLGGIIACSGKRVVIIDLDMRKPKVHKGFQVDNDRGMSTLLIRRDTLDNCIQAASLENLFFITAGPIPPNPAELIISSEMDNILAELRNRFDVIIIDTPPVGLVTDGVHILQRADYPIYVFRSDYSKKHFIQNLDRVKNESRIDKISAILNGVDFARHRYAYRYGYGRGYGYGYGSGDNHYEDTTADRRAWWKIWKKKA
jgi:capsular exopolysaccharide synthesis family protein